jgi:hypothetical protein
MLEVLFNPFGKKTQDLWLGAKEKGGPPPALFVSAGRFMNRPYASSSSSMCRVKFFARPAGAIMP